MRTHLSAVRLTSGNPAIHAQPGVEGRGVPPCGPAVNHAGFHTRDSQREPDVGLYMKNGMKPDVLLGDAAVNNPAVVMEMPAVACVDAG